MHSSLSLPFLLCFVSSSSSLPSFPCTSRETRDRVSSTALHFSSCVFSSKLNLPGLRITATMVDLCKLGVPNWLETLMREEFFRQCAVHESSRKNERNVFCLDCCSSFCPQCLSSHTSHRLIQIRRYVYQNVIRLDDLEKLIDCAFVQSYINNSAKVVFINDRPQTRPFRVSGHVCSTCDRPLQDPYHFCSLSCKVNHLANSKEGISTYLYECNYLPLSDIDNSHQTPDSVLESPNLSSGNNSPVGGAGGECPEPPSLVLASGPGLVVRKKRSSFVQPSSSPVMVIVPADPSVLSPSPPTHPVGFSVNMKRRKGAPTRSPLY